MSRSRAAGRLVRHDAQLRAHHDADAWRDRAPVAPERTAARAIAGGGARLVGDERAAGAVRAQREVAGDPRDARPRERREVARVDLLPCGAAAPEAAGGAERHLR